MAIHVWEAGPCPTCKGTKIHTMPISTLTDKGWSHTSCDIPCMSCDATGVVTQEKADDMNYYASLWCKCEVPCERPRYVKDTRARKHHWKCTKCNKMVQEG